jgi:tetratricopeptide (TPR) repeat protein
MAAVRRIADQGDIVQARQRLAALRKGFPAFKPLLGLAWEVEDHSGTAMLAAARAYEWQSASPGSRAALEALCTSAGEAGLSALYADAMFRLDQVDNPDPDAAPPEQTFDAPLGALTMEQAMAIDLSRIHLADNQPQAAAEVLKGIDHPSARNNLALALFIGGDLRAAREVIEAAWQAEPANLFALERAVRWRCWSEGLAPCLQFAAVLSATLPRRPEDAVARVGALRFLGDSAAATAAWRDSDELPFWDHYSDEQRELFDDLSEPDAELPGNTGLWFPQLWIQALTALSAEPGAERNPQWPPRWDACLDQCDAHSDFLERAAELGDRAIRYVALEVLKRRAIKEVPGALPALRLRLTRPGGNDSERMALTQWLAREGFHSRSEGIDVWLTGQLRNVRPLEFTLTDEPRPSPYPPKGQALNVRMQLASRRGALDEALALATQLLGMYPREPSAYANLAAIKEGLGHPQAEIDALYDAAFSMAPDYLFGRLGRARCLIGQGQLAQARELLVSLMDDRQEWHRSEYRSLLKTQHMMALASGEHETAAALTESLRDLDQRFAT